MAMYKGLKINGIKKVLNEYNNNYDLCGIIYYDMSDGAIWYNVYADTNSWDNYHDSNIIQICKQYNLGHRIMTKDELKELIYQKVNENKKDIEEYTDWGNY